MLRDFPSTLRKWNNKSVLQKWVVEKAFKTAVRAGDAETIKLLLLEVEEGWGYVVYSVF